MIRLPAGLYSLITAYCLLSFPVGAGTGHSTDSTDGGDDG